MARGPSTCRWAESLADTDYPDREVMLAAEMARGETLLQQLDDVADVDVDRLKAQYQAVRRAT